MPAKKAGFPLHGAGPRGYSGAARGRSHGLADNPVCCCNRFQVLACQVVGYDGGTDSFGKFHLYFA
jgi:hypothetical protein